MSGRTDPATVDSGADDDVCIACGKTIPRAATLCSHCSSYQKNWKNTLRYTANVSAAISLFVAAIAVALSVAPLAFKSVFWTDEVAVLSLKTTDGMTVANIGDGDLYLTHLHFNGQARVDDKIIGVRSNRRVDRRLGNAEILRVDLSKQAPYPYTVFSGGTPADWEAVLRRAFDTQDRCVVPIVYLRDGPSISLLRSSLGDRLRTFDAQANLYYYSVYQRRLQEAVIPATGTVGVSYSADCAAARSAERTPSN